MAKAKIKAKKVEKTTEESKEPKFVSVEHFSHETMTGDKKILIVKSKGFTKETNQYVGNISNGGSILAEDGTLHSLYIITEGHTIMVNATLGEDILIEVPAKGILVKQP